MPRTRMIIADGWAERLAKLGLPDLAVLLDDAPPAGRLPGTWEALVKPGLGGRERWRWRSADGETVLYVKRYLHTPAGAQFDRVWRQAAQHSRAWWEFDASRDLAERSVRAVRAVAAIEQMSASWERRSAVLFEVAPGEAFDRVWPTLCARDAALTRGAARHVLTRRLARYVSAFHQTGQCHRDLYLCHIFAELDPAAARPPQFAILDLARVHRPRLRRFRWLIKDLSQLDVSARQCGATRTDRLRFLVAYLGLEQRRAPRVRYYARRVLRKSDRILQRIVRRQTA